MKLMKLVNGINWKDELKKENTWIDEEGCEKALNGVS